MDDVSTGDERGAVTTTPEHVLQIVRDWLERISPGCLSPDDAVG